MRTHRAHACPLAHTGVVSDLSFMEQALTALTHSAGALSMVMSDAWFATQQ